MPVRQKKRRNPAKEERQAHLRNIYQKLRIFLNEAEKKRQTDYKNYSKDIQRYIKELEQDIVELKQQGSKDKRERQIYLENIRQEINNFLNDAERKRQTDYSKTQKEYITFIKGIKREVSSIKEDTQQMLEGF